MIFLDINMKIPRHILDIFSRTAAEDTPEKDYVWDPEHKNKPEGGNWKETDKGWTKAKKIQKEKKTTQKPSTVQVSNRKEIDQNSKSAAKSVEEYYGRIDDGEKAKVFKETEELLKDFITKAANGEPARLPDLSDEAKIKFLQALFITIKAKQIESVNVQDETLQKNRDKIVNDLYGHANKAMSEVVSELSTKSITRKRIDSSDPKNFVLKSNKDLEDQDDSEFSNSLALSDQKDYINAFRRKPEMRGKTFDELDQDMKEAADTLAFNNSVYGQNFSRLNWSIKDLVKYKALKNKSSFTVGNYKQGPESVVSDVQIPLKQAKPQEMAKSMNAVMKKLAALGFEGVIETSTNAEDIAMNKGMLRVITDNPRHALAVNDIISETFKENGIDAKSSIHKNGFGMNEEDLFDFGTRLRKIVSKQGERFTIPLKELQNYMAAARWNGLDLKPEREGKFSLVPHVKESELGRLSINVGNKKHPKELISEMYFADKKDRNPVKEESKPEPLPFEDEFKDIRDSYGQETPMPDFSILDEEPPVVQQEPRKKKEVLTPSAENKPIEEAVVPPAPAFDGEKIEDSLKAISDKAVRKDETVFEDIRNSVQGMLDDVQAGRNARLYPQYKKAIGKIALALLQGQINDKTPPEVSALIGKLDDGIKNYQAPSIPKTTKDFNFASLPNYSEFTGSVDKAEHISDPANRDTGWRYAEVDGKPKLVSKQGQHALEFKSKEEAKTWARKNPYIGDKFRVDPVEDFDSELENDLDLHTGSKISKSIEPDISGISSLASHYGLKENDERLKYLLGLKRNIFYRMKDSDKKDVYSNGFPAWISKQNPADIKTSFLDLLASSEPEKADELKKSWDSIPPKDFVKLLSGISPKKVKTSSISTQRRISMKVFDTYEKPQGLIPVQKIPVIVSAMKVEEPFRVKSLEGDYAQGKPGDWLIHGIKGENYICDNDIFHKTYVEILAEHSTPRRA